MSPALHTLMHSTVASQCDASPSPPKRQGSTRPYAKLPRPHPVSQTRQRLTPSHNPSAASFLPLPPLPPPQKSPPPTPLPPRHDFLQMRVHVPPLRRLPQRDLLEGLPFVDVVLQRRRAGGDLLQGGVQACGVGVGSAKHGRRTLAVRWGLGFVE